MVPDVSIPLAPPPRPPRRAGRWRPSPAPVPGFGRPAQHSLVLGRTGDRLGEKVRVAFALDCCDREAMGRVATTGGITAEDVRDRMVATVEHRFGPVDPSHRADRVSRRQRQSLYRRRRQALRARKTRATCLCRSCQQRGDDRPFSVGTVACLAHPWSVISSSSGFGPAHVISVVFATRSESQLTEIAQLNVGRALG